MLLVINLGKLNKSVMAKESGIAKSIGDQKEQDLRFADTILINFLLTGKKNQRSRLVIENDIENNEMGALQNNMNHVTSVNLIFQRSSSVILWRDR